MTTIISSRRQTGLPFDTEQACNFSSFNRGKHLIGCSRELEGVGVLFDKIERNIDGFEGIFSLARFEVVHWDVWDVSVRKP